MKRDKKTPAATQTSQTGGPRQRPDIHHPILSVRLGAITTNLLALRGGKEYVRARLSRFPAESDIDFLGVTSGEAVSSKLKNLKLSECEGRRDRAYVPNYAGRIAEKLNQYVFQTPVLRDGIDPKFAINCTATGETIGQFMAEASSLITACRWCWASVGRPFGKKGESLKSRAERGDRVFWRLWEPSEVINWEFDAAGNLIFVVTSENVSSQFSPWENRSDKKRVTVWERGKITVFDGDAFSEAETGLDFVPFKMIGAVAETPWWFDDVEMCQKTLLDKQSALDTAIFKMVYPILVLPSSALESLQQEEVGPDEMSNVVKMKIGMSSPIVESPEDSGITRYVGGSTTDIAFIREEIRSCVEELYETVGLALKTESRAAQSGEAKAWDHLDAEAVLAQRAEVLENAETALVEMSRAVGVNGAFTGWEPRYSRAFDLTPLTEDIESVLKVNGLPLPSKAIMQLVKVAYAKVAQDVGVPNSVVDEMGKLIEEYDPDAKVIDSFRPSKRFGGKRPDEDDDDLDDGDDKQGKE